MRRSFLLVSVAMVLAVAMAFPASAATTVAHGQFHGFNADAVFRAQDGTVVTDVDVALVTGRATGSFPPPGVGSLPVATVSIEVHDEDTLVLQAFGAVTLGPDEFTMDETKLASASVATTIPAVDAYGNAFNVSVDVQWTASGRYENQVGGYTLPSEFVTRFIGKSRAFMTASGSVSWGSTSFDDWSTDGGFIMKVNYFETTIVR